MAQRRSAKLPLLVGLSLLALTGCRKGDPAPPAGRVAEELRLPSLDGPTFEPERLAGKKTLLNFWRPGCGHCVTELPELQAAAADPDVELVTVIIAGRKDHARAMAARQGFTGPILLDVGGRLRRLYEIEQVPYTLVLDRDGFAKKAMIGGRDREAFRRALAVVE